MGAKPPTSEPALVRQPSRPPSAPIARPERKQPPRPAGPKKTSAPKAQAAPAKKPTRRAEQAKRDQESQQIDDDDFLISDDMDQPRPKHIADPFGVGDQARVRSTHSLFERAPDPDEEHGSPGDDTDESWAMSLLEEEEADTDQAPTEPSRRSESEPPADFELMATPEGAPGASDEATIRFHLAGDDSDAAHGEQRSEPLRAQDPERSALLMGIDPEPVEMNWTRKRARSRRWLWPLLIALALVALLAQVAWLQFDRWNRTEPYRSLYGAVCPLLGCELPDLVDRSRIRAYNLVVRNHPDQQGALVVDAILLNTARFDQPFPDLVLEFSDLNGNTVAARQFTPGEYLSGELAGRTRMPANQPVHLTLELVDPGPKAVNYRAYIPQ